MKAKGKEIRDLQAKLHEKATNLRFEIWEVLNPEQRAQFDPFVHVAGLGYCLNDTQRRRR